MYNTFYPFGIAPGGVIQTLIVKTHDNAPGAFYISFDRLLEVKKNKGVPWHSERDRPTNILINCLKMLYMKISHKNAYRGCISVAFSFTSASPTLPKLRMTPFTTSINLGGVTSGASDVSEPSTRTTFARWRKALPRIWEHHTKGRGGG